MSHLADALREAIPWLKTAAEDYAALEMYRALQDTLYLLAVLYHNLGMIKDRDEVAERHHRVGKEREEAEKQATEPWITEVLDIVSEISVALAAR